MAGRYHCLHEVDLCNLYFDILLTHADREKIDYAENIDYRACF